MNGRYKALSLIALVAGIGGGIAVERYYLGSPSMDGDGGQEILYWVAPMDPNFRQDNPGKSPMGMDLIPVYETDEAASDPSEVTLSGREINAIGVRSAVARTSQIANRIETVGFVAYDDSKTTHVHTRINGWVETLDVRSIGETVKEGDRLYQLFSPEFGVASFDALNTLKTGRPNATQAARDKLRSHGTSERQIDEIISSGQSQSKIDVYAPQDGVIINLAAAEGAYLQPGTEAVSITDLSTVWIIVDVFERDISKLATEMTAVADFEHLPASSLEGVIDYIYPALDEKTRTLPVRLKFENANGLLKPNMFGTVSLTPAQTRDAVTVPSEAVIRTGKAERVILKTGEGTFKPRLVTTGLRNSFGDGEQTEIIQGLNAGEEIVASAQFLIDSESSLSAGLTRMSPTNEAPARASGKVISIDVEKRIAVIEHEAIESMGWPAMKTEFPVLASVNLARIDTEMDVTFMVSRGTDGVLAIREIGANDGVAATGRGVVTAVTAEGKLNIEHDAIPDIGWPAMQMDLPVIGFDPLSVMLNEPVEFDLAKANDSNYNVVAVRGTMDSDASDMTKDDIANDPMMETEMVEVETMKPPTVAANGVINSIDVEKRIANITHGPMTDIGMPGMTMDFAIDEDVDLKTLPSGEETALEFIRNEDFSMTLVGSSAEMGAKP